MSDVTSVLCYDKRMGKSMLKLAMCNLLFPRRDSIRPYELLKWLMWGRNRPSYRRLSLHTHWQVTWRHGRWNINTKTVSVKMLISVDWTHAGPRLNYNHPATTPPPFLHICIQKKHLAGIYMNCIFPILDRKLCFCPSRINEVSFDKNKRDETTVCYIADAVTASFCNHNWLSLKM